MSKKFALLTALVFLCSFLMATPALAATYPYLNSVELVIGDKNATVNDAAAEMDQAAYTKNGRTLVPFRFLAEALGAEVAWDANTRTASLSLKGSEVKVTLGSTVAYINGKQTTLDVPAESKGGRTFIPLRFVSEALGASVDYDAESKAVSVVLVDTTDWKTFTDPNGGQLSYPTGWTVSGDTSSDLTIESPLGTKMTGTLDNSEVASIIDDSKMTYEQKGFELIADGPIDSANPEDGQMLGFVYPDSANLDNSDVVMVIVIPESDGNIVFEVTTKYSAMNADLAIIKNILSVE